MGRRPRPAKKFGRKRRVAGWVLLALGVLVAGVWVRSGWERPHVPLGPYKLTLYRGQCFVFVVPEHGLIYDPGAWIQFEGGIGSLTSDVARDPAGDRLGWWQSLQASRGDGEWVFLWERPLSVQVADSRWDDLTLLALPAWPLPFLLWTPAALLLRSGIVVRRRAMKGMCPKCGYSLAGLANDAPCPECGQGGPKAN